MPTSGLPSHAGKTLLVDVDDATVLLGGERVVDGVSLCIHAGEFIGLIGPNGAGKTTFLRALLGLQPVSAGTIRRTAQARIGYVPQRGAVHDSPAPLSVSEVVALGGGNRAAARSALASVGLETVAGKRFSDLSGGQQQRVLIAKALAGRPSLLILDEPTTGIDELAQREFFAILDGLAHEGITILMVSHDVEAVVAQVGRIICLNRHVLYDGAPAAFEMNAYLPDMYGTRHRALHHQHGQRGEQ